MKYLILLTTLFIMSCASTKESCESLETDELNCVCEGDSDDNC